MVSYAVLIASILSKDLDQHESERSCVEGLSLLICLCVAEAGAGPDYVFARLSQRLLEYLVSCPSFQKFYKDFCQ